MTPRKCVNWETEFAPGVSPCSSTRLRLLISYLSPKWLSMLTKDRKFLWLWSAELWAWKGEKVLKARGHLPRMCRVGPRSFFSSFPLHLPPSCPAGRLGPLWHPGECGPSPMLQLEGVTLIMVPSPGKQERGLINLSSQEHWEKWMKMLYLANHMPVVQAVISSFHRTLGNSAASGGTLGTQCADDRRVFLLPRSFNHPERETKSARKLCWGRSQSRLRANPVPSFRALWPEASYLTLVTHGLLSQKWEDAIFTGLL